MQRTLSAFGFLLLTITPARAFEDWPSVNLHWPEGCHGGHCKAMSLDSYMISGLEAPEKGRLFEVNRYGAFFFTSCNDLVIFVHDRIVDPNVHKLAAGRVLIALENFLYSTGRAHDEQYGDGFVFMAPDTDPLSTLQPHPRLNHIVRRSRNDLIAILGWWAKHGADVHRSDAKRPKLGDTPIQGCH